MFLRLTLPGSDRGRTPCDSLWRHEYREPYLADPITPGFPDAALGITIFSANRPPPFRPMAEQPVLPPGSCLMADLRFDALGGPHRDPTSRVPGGAFPFVVSQGGQEGASEPLLIKQSTHTMAAPPQTAHHRLTPGICPPLGQTKLAPPPAARALAKEHLRRKFPRESNAFHGDAQRRSQGGYFIGRGRAAARLDLPARCRAVTMTGVDKEVFSVRQPPNQNPIFFAASLMAIRQCEPPAPRAAPCSFDEALQVPLGPDSLHSIPYQNAFAGPTMAAY